MVGAAGAARRQAQGACGSSAAGAPASGSTPRASAAAAPAGGTHAGARGVASASGAPAAAGSIRPTASGAAAACGTAAEGCAGMPAGTPSAAGAEGDMAGLCIAVAAVAAVGVCYAGAGEGMYCRPGRGPGARTPVWVSGSDAAGAAVARSSSARRWSARTARAIVFGLYWARSTCDSGPEILISRKQATWYLCSNLICPGKATIRALEIVMRSIRDMIRATHPRRKNGVY